MGIIMNKLILALLLVAGASYGASPTFQSFNTNQFDISNNKVAIEAGARLTNSALYGNTTNLDGSMYMRSNNAVVSLNLDGSEGSRFWWDLDHPTDGEYHFDANQFSFNAGMNNQKRAYSHFGTSLDTQDVWVFQHEGAANSTRTNSPSKQSGWASQYWDGSASVISRVGFRLFPGDTTGTNAELRLRSWFPTPKIDANGGVGNDVPHTNWLAFTSLGVGFYNVDNVLPNLFPMSNRTNGLIIGASSLKYIRNGETIYLDAATNSYPLMPIATATVGTTALELPPFTGFNNIHTYRILGANTPSFQWSIPLTFAGGRTTFVTHISVLKTNSSTATWEVTVFLNAPAAQHIVSASRSISFPAGTNTTEFLITNTFAATTFSASNIISGAVKIARTPGETDTSYLYGGFIRTQ